MSGATFNPDFMKSIGGYPKGSLIASRTGHRVWVSLVDGNMTDPDDAGADGWESRQTGAAA